MAPVLIMSALLFFGSKVIAQTAPAAPWGIDAALETGIPAGNLSNYTEYMLGSTARLHYNTSNNFGIILTSGFYDMIAGSTTNIYTKGNVTYLTTRHDLSIVPVKVGIKDFFENNTYFTAEGGEGFETNYKEHKKLILSPGIGRTLGPWEARVRYEDFSGKVNNYGLVGLRIAYEIGS